MKKRGFTLIEIIIAIVLITLLSTTTIITIVHMQKKKANEKYNTVLAKADLALDVYLSNHPEVYENLITNAEGAIVTLEVLKNEGLISDKIKDPNTNKIIDYANNYYVLSDAVLLSDENSSSTQGSKECNGQVGITVIKNWEVLNGTIAEDNVIYVCPKNNENSLNNGNSGIDELEKRISALEKNTGNEKKIFSGENVNNYVYFNVDDVRKNSSSAFWPTSNKNLWRIYSYYGIDGSTNNIKLIYSEPVEINKSYITVTKTQKTGYTYYIKDTTNQVTFNNVYQTNCRYNGRTVYIMDNEYYNYYGCYGKCKYKREYVLKINTSVSDYLPDTFECTSDEMKYDKSQFDVSLDSNGVYPENSIKNHLYQNIIHKDWVESFPYYIYYNGTNRIDAKLNYSTVVYDKIGVLTQNEFVDSITAAKTWLSYYTNSFIGKLDYSFDTYMVFPEISGKVDTRSTKGTTADLIPVVTLKSGIKIVTDDSCSNPGTKACPYKLSYNGETTSK